MDTEDGTLVLFREDSGFVNDVKFLGMSISSLEELSSVSI